MSTLYGHAPAGAMLTLFHMGYFFNILAWWGRFSPPLVFSETTKDITMKLSSIVFKETFLKFLLLRIACCAYFVW